MGPIDCKGGESVTLKFLLLGSLRFLATGCSFEMIEELTNVSNDKHRTFPRLFHKLESSCCKIDYYDTKNRGRSETCDGVI